MSMNTYGLSESGTFLIDTHAAAYISLAYARRHGDVPASIQAHIDDDSFNALAQEGELPEDFCDLSVALDILELLNAEVCHCSEFEGTAETSFPDKTSAPLNVSYNDDLLIYIPCNSAPSLIHSPYQSEDDILEEFKQVFFSLGVEFPPDFDWWSHICNIDGTYFC